MLNEIESLPLEAMTQAKFAHMNSQELITWVPGYSEAQAAVNARLDSTRNQLQLNDDRYKKLYQKFSAESDSAPRHVIESYIQEIEDLMNISDELRKSIAKEKPKVEEMIMAPIYQKLFEAVRAVDKAEGVVYIFDLACISIPFIGPQSIDVTAKVRAQLGKP